MELLTLNQNFQPIGSVENYGSLIWTERYDKNGDFEIRSSDINHLVNLLPRKSYVCLRDSTVPMIVETHKLVKPLRDKPEVAVIGRSFETVLDRRGSVNQLDTEGPRTLWAIDALKESDAAYLAMRIVLGDSAQTRDGDIILPSTPPAVSVLDAIPQIELIMPVDYYDLLGATVWNVDATYLIDDRVRHLGYVWLAIGESLGVEPSSFGPATAHWLRQETWRPYEIKPQNLYTTVLELIQTNRRGIKAVRPLTNETKVGVEIYNGANLTGEGDTGDPNNVLTIDARFDQIDDATYLLSEQGSTNVGYIYGADGAQQVLKTAAEEPSGLERRVLVLDNSTDSGTIGSGAVTSSDIRKTRGLIELYKYNATALFDGEVAEQIAKGYNRDYFLGDILKLVGDYGLTQNVRVAEFIRSSDASGERAYPTFEAVDD